jgi:uncharacterized membrane protein
MTSSHTPKKKPALAFWMIALGLLSTWIVAPGMQKGWAYRTLEAKFCDILMLLSGILLLAAGAAYFLYAAHHRTAATVGAIAAGVFSATLIVGGLSGLMPCSGPT